MRRTWLACLVLLTLCCSISASQIAMAQRYQFTKIADRTETFVPGDFSFRSTSINNQ